MKKIFLIIFSFIILSGASAQWNPWSYYGSKNVTAPLYSQEATDYFNRMIVQPTERRKITLNTIVKQIKDTLNITTLNQRFRGLYLMKAQTSQVAGLNVARVGDSLTMVGSVEFIADRGFKNDVANSYFNTNFNPTADSSCFKKYSNSVAFNVITGGTGNDQLFGMYISATSGITTYPSYSGSLTINNLGQGNYISKNIGGVRTGLMGSSRMASTKFYAILNSSLTDSLTHSALAMPNANMYLLAMNQNNVAASITLSEIDYGWIANGMTNTEVRGMYNIYNNYVQLINGEKTLLIFDGNSLCRLYAETIRLDSVTYFPNENPYLICKDVAIAGQQISSMITNFNTTITPLYNSQYRNKILFFQEGLLTIQYGSDGTVASTRIKQYNDSAHAKGFITILPTQTAFSYESVNETRDESYRVALNDSILASPNRHADCIIDFRNQRYYVNNAWYNIESPLAISLDTDGLEDNTLYFYDKVHYTTLTTNHIINQYIIPVLRILNIK